MKRSKEHKAVPGRSSNTGTVQAAEQILAGRSKKRGLARMLPFLGPAFVASVAYMDPGNFATNIQGGAKFGYTLLWVVVASNLMGMLIQALSAKLGIATGLNLAEHCRDRFPRPVVWGMWVLMEIVAMATEPGGRLSCPSPVATGEAGWGFTSCPRSSVGTSSSALRALPPTRDPRLL
jgi:manganese transport protein